MQLEHWIGQDVRQTGIRQRRPDRAEGNLFRQLTGDNKTANHHARTSFDSDTRRDIEQQLGGGRLNHGWRRWCGATFWGCARRRARSRRWWRWGRNARERRCEKSDRTILNRVPVGEGVIVSGYG